MSSYSTQNRAPYPSEQPFAAASTRRSPGMSYAGSDYEGKRAAQLSLAYGVLGMFLFWFVFGPLAISSANKAERMGEPAAGGRLLGWVAIILGALSILLIIGWVLFFAAAFTSGFSTGTSV
ncbi:hypothetical protein GCM10009784_27410 [Arthrobacter parietis]|uniref:DUF4190 domain-containing protein n=2 Tax=Arthrobacter TaxID=1663 RepID=A0ABT6CQ72_9MICC|nr:MULTISPECIES: hypothetical protein [Arthrobacter]KRF03449.1 hypothetical protein ASH00_15630 [Arthrobacter sp. Soil782]MDF9276288.1 hypothetical protein [Arthrobacter vasquezii]